MSTQPSVEQVETLRDLFMKKCEKEPIPCGKFHPKDVERVQSNNVYVGNFLEHNDLDMKLSLQMVWDVCIWRKNFGTNDIKESNIRMDYLNDGLVFPRNTDKDGKTLLIFKTKNHTKGSKDMGELLRVVVYWIERLFDENKLDKISVFFDMQGTSVGNVDMELIKKIIEILKLYPLPLNYILIYEMPWILNAAFKIIKALLPPKAVAIMKFINKKTISEYIDVDNMLACWGGKDNYTFSFEPSQPNKKSSLSSTGDGEKSVNNNEEHFDMRSSIRKVHFANSSPTKVSMSDAEEHLTPHDEDMLRLSPRDVIVLSSSEDSSEEDLVGTVEITCTSKYPITYKIKTTSPLKFRVRPSAGALNPGATVSVNVILQPGKQVSSANKDKFLVMCTALPDDVDVNNSQFITDFWKGLPPNSPNVQQHRLQCVSSQGGGLLRNGQMHAPDEFGEKSCSNNEVAQLSDNVKRLERQMKLSINLHWISLLVFIIVSIAFTYILKQEIQEQNLDSCSKFK